MGRPRRDENAVPTELRILQAAEAHFGEVGFGPARLEDIAEKVGIRRPSLLYHFGTKEALYSAVIHKVVGALRDAIAPSMSMDGSFEERLLSLVDAFVVFLEERVFFAPLIVREIVDGHGPGRDLVLDGLVPIVDLLERWIGEDGGDLIVEGLPVRSAVMQVASNAVLRASSGPLRDPLWGQTSQSRALTRCLFFGRS